MGFAVGDYDRDSDFDVYVTGRTNGDFLMANTAALTFEDKTGDAKVWYPGENYVSWGTLFVDFDNDGWLDLFIANGYLKLGFGDEKFGGGGINVSCPKLQNDNLFHANGDGILQT